MIMKHFIIMSALLASIGAMISSCEKYDEVPPEQVQEGSSYKLPDPTPLTQEDRDVISAMQKEYNENAE